MLAKVIVIYLILGMMLTGFGYGLLLKDCPDEKVTAIDMIASTLLYPGMILAILMSSDGKKPTCAVKSN
jgi:hypothetical protein